MANSGLRVNVELDIWLLLGVNVDTPFDLSLYVLQNASLDSYSGTVGINYYLQHIRGGAMGMYRCPGSPRDTGLILICKLFEPMRCSLLGSY